MARYQQNLSMSEFKIWSKENPAWPRFYAEGDSWFAYPLYGGNVLRWVSQRRRICMMSRANNGHTLESMTGAKQRLRLIRDFQKFTFDAILLSAGGNDIAGEGLIHFVNPWEAGMRLQEAIRTDLVACKMKLMRSQLEEFIAIRDEWQPDVPIYIHEYDLPYPNGEPALKSLGPLKRGPWLQPSLEQRGIPVSRRRSITSWLLREYKQMVHTLRGPMFRVVPTQGKLKSVREWTNELHPSMSGFKTMAQCYRKELAKQFPNHF